LQVIDNLALSGA